MKKILCALVVLTLAATASAEVKITCVQPGDCNALVSYECTSGEVVRCFGLNVQLNNDETIDAIVCLSDDYYINPGNFSYDGVTPDFGDPACLCDAGEPDTLDGLDSNGITVAMCSLYDDDDPDHNTPPASSGDLFLIELSQDATVTITENGQRGGVIDEDNVDIDPNLPAGTVIDCPAGECMGVAHPNYAVWQSVGMPNCWCYPRQGRGDVDGLQEYGAYWVMFNDLALFTGNFGITGVAGEPNICADLCHDEEYGAYRVMFNDLAIFTKYFGATTVPCCDQDMDCDETNDAYFNFWLMTP
jgi:hypothetical protein